MKNKHIRYAVSSLLLTVLLSSCEIRFGGSLGSYESTGSLNSTTPISQSGSTSVTDIPSDWYVVGSFNEWTVIDSYMLVARDNEDYEYRYQINLSLNVGDVLKVQKNTENPLTLGFDNLGGETVIANYSRDDDGGVKINTQDNYDIYVNVLGENYELEMISSSSVSFVDVSFSAINDFHGAINRNVSNNIVGISYLSSYLKDKKSNGDILISSGDMWQGTFESNFNSGKLVTEVFKNVGFDALVLGNHEFDWGDQAIFENQRIQEKDYLGANIYEYDENRNPCYGNKAILGGDYTVKTINAGTVNEVKVGIIGVIGKNQLSSIQANFVQDYVFLDPTETVQTLSTYLRNDLNCDVVVASYHAGQDDVDKSIVGGTNGSGTKYVDAVFCAHTHQKELSYVNSVPFIQSGSNGRYVGEVTLRLTKDTGEVLAQKAINTDLLSVNLQPDSEVSEIVARYNNASSVTGSEVVGEITSIFDKNSTLSNAIAKGMYDATVKKGVTVDYAITNYARNSISSGKVTYGQVYTAVPFDNAIVICEVTGRDIYNELVNYTNYFYRGTSRILENSNNTTYTIAVCSYLAYHIKIDNNTYLKTLNYFPSMKNVYELELSSGVTYTYRQALLDIFASTTNSIDPNTFMGDNYDSSLLTSTI